MNKKKLNFFVLALLSLVFYISGCKTGEMYIFSYFTDNGEDGLHLLYSEDTYNWQKLNNGKSFLTPEVGTDRLMRDPCIIKGPNNQFHMVWTVSWKEKGIGYASSENLLEWSQQKYLPVMEHEENALNCWAPEIFWDDDSDVFIIYWSTTIPGKFPLTETGAYKKRNHRIYYTLTKDFKEFSETKLLYDPGFNVIDAVIKKDKHKYIMFIKDETHSPEPVKRLKIAYSNYLTHGYSKASEPISIS